MSKESNNRSQQKEIRLEDDENWPRRLNRILISIGVIAFGLIIADRLISIYKTEDSATSTVASTDSAQTDQQSLADADQPGSVVVGEKTPIERTPIVDLQEEFGSRLVFVSLSEPKYVITEDEQRFDVGSAVNDQTLLVGIMENRVVLEKAGDLAAFELGDLTSQ